MSSKMDFSRPGKFTKSPNMPDIFPLPIHFHCPPCSLGGRADLMGCIERASLSPNLQLSLDHQKQCTDQDGSEDGLFMTLAFPLTGHIEAGWIHPPAIRRPFARTSLFLSKLGICSSAHSFSPKTVTPLLLLASEFTQFFCNFNRPCPHFGK